MTFEGLATTTGSNEMLELGFKGLGRIDANEGRCQVGAEWIASRLALTIGLPVPTGGLIEGPRGLSYVMMRFGDGSLPPPLDADEFAARHPAVTAGAVVFDLWIANCDRTEFNLAEDGDFKRPVLFDHEQALGGGYHDRLLQLPGLGGEVDVFEEHDLALNETVTESRYLGPWVGRVLRLDAEQVRAPCDDLYRIGYWPKPTADAVAYFLNERRNHLWDLLKETCKNVPAWQML